MAAAGKRQRLALRIASVPMGVLALSCLYPIFFAVNNAFKTRHDYLQDRFGLVENPTFDNFVQAWTRSHLDQYFLNSVIATLGAVLLLTVVSSLAGFALAAPALSLPAVPVRGNPVVPDDPGAGRAGALHEDDGGPQPGRHACRAHPFLYGILPACSRSI